VRCDLCGAPAVAVEPGCEGEHNLFLLRRPVPRRQWCAEHWPALAPAPRIEMPKPRGASAKVCEADRSAKHGRRVEMTRPAERGA